MIESTLSIFAPDKTVDKRVIQAGTGLITDSYLSQAMMSVRLKYLVASGTLVLCAIIIALGMRNVRITVFGHQFGPRKGNEWFCDDVQTKSGWTTYRSTVASDGQQSYLYVDKINNVLFLVTLKQVKAVCGFSYNDTQAVAYLSPPTSPTSTIIFEDQSNRLVVWFPPHEPVECSIANSKATKIFADTCQQESTISSHDRLNGLPHRLSQNVRHFAPQEILLTLEQASNAEIVEHPLTLDSIMNERDSKHETSNN